MVATVYTGRNYVLLKEAYPSVVEALRPPTKDRVVEAVQLQLPTTGPGEAASGLVAGLASERSASFRQWEQEIKLREVFARNELGFWLTALVLSAVGLVLVHRQTKNVP